MTQESLPAAAASSDALTDSAVDHEGRNKLAAAVVSGHAVKHLYLSAMQSILLPEIRIAYGLSGTQLGTLATMRQVSGWSMTIGSGYLGDRFSSRTGLILAWSLGLLGLSYWLIGASNSYEVLLVAFFLAGLGPSVYHSPAIGALSRRFPDKRAFAVSLHGMGGSVGEVLGPLVASGLLLVLTWQGILQLSLIPALLSAVIIWRVMGNVGLTDNAASSLQTYLRGLAALIRHRALALLVVITALRSMGQSAVMIFLPVYLREDLGYGVVTVAVLLSMAQVAGIGSQPVMGYLSDRIGHQRVLVPAMVTLGFTIAALAFADGMVQLVLIIAVLGAFLYSLHAIFISAAITAAGSEAHSTIVSIIYGASILGAVSPIVAGMFADHFGTQSVFLYAAATTFAATLILALMKLPHVRSEVTAH